MARIRSILNPTPACPSRSRLSTAAWSLPAVGLIVALLATTGTIGDTTRNLTPIWMPQSVSQWNTEFETAAERHGVDPALLAILTLVESRGNPQAISRLGSVGLMQILPATAETIAKERGLSDFQLDDLLDPSTNIDFGAWYLAEQIDEFGDGTFSGGTVGRVAIAYNGGPGQLRRHLDQGTELTRETAGYVSTVQQLWRDRDKERSETLERMLQPAR